jgi:hypothetical protein
LIRVAGATKRRPSLFIRRNRRRTSDAAEVRFCCRVNAAAESRRLDQREWRRRPDGLLLPVSLAPETPETGSRPGSNQFGHRMNKPLGGDFQHISRLKSPATARLTRSFADSSRCIIASLAQHRVRISRSALAGLAERVRGLEAERRIERGEAYDAGDLQAVCAQTRFESVQTADGALLARAIW